jgi:hypothetical protein
VPEDVEDTQACLSNIICDVTLVAKFEEDSHMGDACVGGRMILKRFLKKLCVKCEI